MKKIYLIAVLILISELMLGQKVTGYVYDSKTSETLPGVAISYKYAGETYGASSDEDGKYEIDVPADAIMLTFTLMGYQSQNVPLILTKQQTINQNIFLEVETQLLGEVVVSAGRFEQRLSDLTVSMEVLKPEQIKRQDPKDIKGVISSLPGVDVTDNQPSIRGGSGWTYGVGSRTQIIMNGYSLLSPGSGEINWNTIPMENIEQVEIIKGASSVLYGSSALNGVISIQTARPSIEPSTTVSSYVGIYDNPMQKSYQWWSKEFWKDGNYEVEPLFRKNLLSGVRNPIYTGLEFSHTRRIGDFDVSGGANIFTDEGYREGNYNKRLRLGGNITYRDPNINYLNYGANVNFLSNKFGDFFIWRSSQQVYSASPIANMGREANILYLEPFLNYTNPNNNTSHKLKTRFYYKSDNIFTSGTGKSLAGIMRDMGVNDKTTASIIEIAKNPRQGIADLWNKVGYEIIPPLMNNDITGMYNVISRWGNHVFPTATNGDYMDLVSWIMNNPYEGDLTQWGLNTIDPKKKVYGTDKTYSYYADYQFNKKFKPQSVLTAGITYEHVGLDSRVTGDHNSDNIGAYAQYDGKFFDKLNVSAGARFEYYRVDSYHREAETNILGWKAPFKPLFRGGLNYELAQYTFIRGSIGQGYRYPSITEKFVVKNLGGVGAYPNFNLEAEEGWNAEIGIKQGYQVGPFKGFIDIAGFYTYYKDMIEFDFGLLNPNPDLNYPFLTSLRQVPSVIAQGYFPTIGIKFGNINKAKIYGIDAQIMGFCDINTGLKLVYNLGYVYTEPRDIDANKRNREEAANTDMLAMKYKSNNSKYLKYRQKHQVKATIDFQWQRFFIGTNMTWKSKTLAVDYLLIDERDKIEKDLMDYVRGIAFGDLDSYWKKHNKDFFVMDLRFGVDVTKKVNMQCNITNLFNKEYSIRPMDVNPPRTYMVKTNIKF